MSRNSFFIAGLSSSASISSYLSDQGWWSGCGLSGLFWKSVDCTASKIFGGFSFWFIVFSLPQLQSRITMLYFLCLDIDHIVNSCRLFIRCVCMGFYYMHCNHSLSLTGFFSFCTNRRNEYDIYVSFWDRS